MRILIENSGYHLQNMGDVAMLQVAAQRIRTAYPNAELLTLTHSAERLERYLGGTPLAPRRRQLWLDSRALPIPIRKSWLPKTLGERMTKAEQRFQVGYPRVAAASIRMLGGSDPKSNNQTSEFVDDVDSCDLVVVAGGGFLTDSFLSVADDVLTTLQLAQNLGKPTLVFGQGFGPLTCHQTCNRVSQVLPKVSHIGIREQRTGLEVLNRCNISASQIVCTGDDAVQLAYDRRTETTGTALGVNLRLANYSGVSEPQKEMVKLELVQFLKRHSMPSVIAPISYFGPEQDAERVREVLQGAAGFNDSIPSDSPESIIDVIGQCRFVVTGSYHAGVFAMSQGIPIVALVASEYYQNKFLGLQDQFGGGCQIIDISAPNGAEQLRAALDHTCKHAPAYRDSLLEAARKQIKLNTEFYAEALSSVS